MISFLFLFCQPDKQENHIKLNVGRFRVALKDMEKMKRIKKGRGLICQQSTIGKNMFI